MKNISEDTLVECTMSIDWELRKMAKEELIRRKGAEFYHCFEEAKKSRAKLKNFAETAGLNISKETINYVTRREWNDTHYWMTEKAIFELFRSGDSALSQKGSTEAAKRYEMAIWKHIHKAYGTFSEDEQQELFACGNLGLVIAMNTGNYDFSSKFSTYSRTFILHEMVDFLNMKGTNPTSYFSAIAKKISAAISELENEGKEASIYNLQIKTGLSEKLIKRELNLLQQPRDLSFESEPWGDSMGLAEKISSGETPENIAMDNILMEQIHDAMRELTEDARTIITMKVMEQLKYSEIAEELNIPTSTVEAKYKKGIAQLKSLCLKRHIFGE